MWKPTTSCDQCAPDCVQCSQIRFKTVDFDHNQEIWPPRSVTLIIRKLDICMRPFTAVKVPVSGWSGHQSGHFAIHVHSHQSSRPNTQLGGPRRSSNAFKTHSKTHSFERPFVGLYGVAEAMQRHGEADTVTHQEDQHV